MDGAWDSIWAWSREHLSAWPLVKVYIACAIAGGTVILGQVGLSLLGVGGGEDVDPDVSVDDLGGGDGLHLLSVRTIAAFLTFFGLVGWTCTEAAWHPAATAGAALGGGLAAMLGVALLMRFFHRLGSSGNIDPAQAIGRTASVYLRVPGERQGKGKVVVTLNGTSVELDAITSGRTLPTGSACRIVSSAGPGTYEVAALD